MLSRSWDELGRYTAETVAHRYTHCSVSPDCCPKAPMTWAYSIGWLVGGALFYQQEDQAPRPAKFITQAEPKVFHSFMSVSKPGPDGIVTGFHEQ